MELRLLCKKCHLAKHLGYALVHKKIEEAMEHLARINNMDLREVIKLAKEAFRIHSKLSHIRNWTIKIGNLRNMDEELKERVEDLLNFMYKRGFFTYGGWLYYRNPRYDERIKSRVAQETSLILSKAINRASTSDVSSEEWQRSPLEVVKEELINQGIQVLEHEFRKFISYLIEENEWQKLLQQTMNKVNIRETSPDNSIMELLDNDILTRKWMVFIPQHYTLKSSDTS